MGLIGFYVCLFFFLGGGGATQKYQLIVFSRVYIPHQNHQNLMDFVFGGLAGRDVAQVAQLGILLSNLPADIYMSHEKNPGWLGYIRDYTTQLYRDYNEPL